MLLKLLPPPTPARPNPNPSALLLVVGAEKEGPPLIAKLGLLIEAVVEAITFRGDFLILPGSKLLPNPVDDDNPRALLLKAGVGGAM